MRMLGSSKSLPWRRKGDEVVIEALPKTLQQYVSHTAVIGKWYLHANPIGFDDWSVLPGQGRYMDPEFVDMGVGEKVGSRNLTVCSGRSTDIVTDKALAPSSP
jgi:uncharacterized sulfatase